MKKIDAYKNNKSLAEFIMTVTGTLLSTKDGDSYRLRTIEPKADQKEFVAAYLKGGSTTKLVCNDSDKCLVPTLSQVTIQDSSENPTATMKGLVNNRITKIRTKYRQSEAFTEEETNFLNDAEKLPVYSYIQVSAAAGTAFIMQEAVEYIACQILLAQFDKALTEIIEAVSAMEKIQIDSTHIQQFKQNLNDSRTRIQNLIIEINSGNSMYTFDQTIKAVEQGIVAKNI